jgi:hypothetical protein
MKIDPNTAMVRQECVWIEDGEVVLHDGTATPADELEDAESAFQEFVRGLDQNLYYVAAFIPDDEDRPVFFQAREVARRLKVHMQATVETSERQHKAWDAYRRAKALRRADVASRDEEES